MRDDRIHPRTIKYLIAGAVLAIPVFFASYIDKIAFSVFAGILALSGLVFLGMSFLNFVDPQIFEESKEEVGENDEAYSGSNNYSSKWEYFLSLAALAIVICTFSRRIGIFPRYQPGFMDDVSTLIVDTGIILSLVLIGFLVRLVVVLIRKRREQIERKVNND